MLLALASYRPDCLISCAISCTFAKKTSSIVLYLIKIFCKAAPEFALEVFWDKIVSTMSQKGSFRSRQKSSLNLTWPKSDSSRCTTSSPFLALVIIVSATCRPIVYKLLLRICYFQLRFKPERGDVSIAHFSDDLVEQVAKVFGSLNLYVG